MQRRTTKHWVQIQLMTGGPVQYDFSKERQGVIQITVPPHSPFKFPYHWHSDGLGCVRLEAIQGRICMFVEFANGRSVVSLGEGVTQEFRLKERVSWRHGHADGPALIVNLTGDVSLFRNICGATIEARDFPFLMTTPFWLRVLCRVLLVKRFLVPQLLWIQLRSIYYAHDFRTCEGRIPFTWFWIAWPFEGPSNRLVKLEAWSVELISRAVLFTRYWTGLLFLGMKGRYNEYTPSQAPPEAEKE